jgi:hypothetical protein
MAVNPTSPTVVRNPGAGSCVGAYLEIGTVLAPFSGDSTKAQTNLVDFTITQAGTATELGIRSGWFGERFDYDSVALAALVGRAVPGLSVGTSAVPIIGRHPILLGNLAQTARQPPEAGSSSGPGRWPTSWCRPSPRQFAGTDDRLRTWQLLGAPGNSSASSPASRAPRHTEWGVPAPGVGPAGYIAR